MQKFTMYSTLGVVQRKASLPPDVAGVGASDAIDFGSHGRKPVPCTMQPISGRPPDHPT